MVVSSFSKNFANHVRSRPPLVVFTICLMGMLVAVLSLAYYVHSKEKILNPDVKQDWFSLLKYASSMDACIDEEDTPKGLQINHEIATIATKAGLTMPFVKQPMNVAGIIPLDEWYPSCLLKENAPSNLHVSFSIVDPNNTKDICLVLTGPKSFIPRFVDNEKICEPVVKQGAKLTTIKFADFNYRKSFCTKGLSGKLTYSFDCYKGMIFDAFLNRDDRKIVNYKLIIACFVLLFILSCIAGYTLIKSRNPYVGDLAHFYVDESL